MRCLHRFANQSKITNPVFDLNSICTISYIIQELEQTSYWERIMLFYFQYVLCIISYVNMRLQIRCSSQICDNETMFVFKAMYAILLIQIWGYKPYVRLDAMSAVLRTWISGCKLYVRSQYDFWSISHMGLFFQVQCSFSMRVLQFVRI